MNEIRRLAYLDALGIDSYVSRRQLPAAAPSRRLRVVRPAAVATTPAPGVAVKELLSAAPAPVCGAESGADAAEPQTGGQRPAATPEAMPMFSVLACYLGGRYWLDEIPRARDPGDNYLPLLQGICVALGWDPSGPVLERFDWPMHHNRQLDQGRKAARHGFEGFMRARLERRPVAEIILLGEAQGEWFDPAVLSGVKLVTTVSAWLMLKQPELKISAWRDLKQLSRTPD